MSELGRATLVEQAREAVSRGDWGHAQDCLRQAEASEELESSDLALLAQVAYAAGRLDLTLDAWERLHMRALASGDTFSAAGAAVRVAMHLLFDTALMAPVRGWIRRAERLLEGTRDPPAPVLAWLDVVRSYERLLSGDLPKAGEWAARAVAFGSSGDPAAAALGLLAEGRCLILAGDNAVGMARLEEAGAAALSGELDPLTTGAVYCELVCALQGLGQYDLAEEWTAAMERWCRHGQPVGSIAGRCRVHRAEILRLRGSCVEAEQEAVVACEELRPYLRRELGWPLTELGRIRLRRDDLDGAEEAFAAAHELGWDPEPGLALLHLARGEVGLAATAIRHALERPLRVPSKELPPNTELRRAPLLAAQVEIAIAAGDTRLAAEAACELTCSAAVFDSKALAASAAFASGRAAAAVGQTDAACDELEKAVRLWNEIGAPHEAAEARMALGHAESARGNTASALRELLAARSIFERLGAERKASEARRACEHIAAAAPAQGPERAFAPEHESSPDARERGPNLLAREGDYWTMSFEGRTFNIRDLKGLRYLVRLLAEPGRDIHVLRLVMEETSGNPDTDNPGLDPVRLPRGTLEPGPLLDSRAREAYRRRLADIDEDLEDADAKGDLERAAQARAERDWLARELSRAVGLGGRDRRTGSASERARASVTRALRQTIRRIQEHHPALGLHLERAVRTGTYCEYRPDREIDWTLRR
jgi:tetratricopeptide (TPR) repeat protein